MLSRVVFNIDTTPNAVGYATLSGILSLGYLLGREGPLRDAWQRRPFLHLLSFRDFHPQPRQFMIPSCRVGNHYGESSYPLPLNSSPLGDWQAHEK
jgi:hypothetical protein